MVKGRMGLNHTPADPGGVWTHKARGASRGIHARASAPPATWTTHTVPLNFRNQPYHTPLWGALDRARTYRPGQIQLMTFINQISKVPAIPGRRVVQQSEPDKKLKLLQKA